MSFEELLGTVNRYLGEHPSEAIIMRVREEDFLPSPFASSFRDIWARDMTRAGARFIKAIDQVPRLGDARGRVLVLRDADFGGQGLAFDDASVKIQDAWQVHGGDNQPARRGESVSIPEKLRLITALVHEAEENNSGGKFLYLNHLSSPGPDGPEDFSARVNQYVSDLIAPKSGKRSLGTLIMDFPGEGLIHQILKSNFP